MTEQPKGSWSRNVGMNVAKSVLASWFIKIIIFLASGWMPSFEKDELMRFQKNGEAI